jgi:hypothetical protein
MSLLDEVLRLIQSAQQPWWIYLLVFLVPLCILISMREFFCWFCKINKIVSRLEAIAAKLENLPPAVNVSNTQPPLGPGPRGATARPETRKGTREFTLE